MGAVEEVEDLEAAEDVNLTEMDVKEAAETAEEMVAMEAAHGEQNILGETRCCWHELTAIEGVNLEDRQRATQEEEDEGEELIIAVVSLPNALGDQSSANGLKVNCTQLTAIRSVVDHFLDLCLRWYVIRGFLFMCGIRTVGMYEYASVFRAIEARPGNARAERTSEGFPSRLLQCI